jgi:hypothetical protein
MKGWSKVALTLAVICIIAASIQVAHAGILRRLSAEFRNFDGTETITAVPPAPGGLGGTPVYIKSVFVPFDSNVVYVTISTTGDTHAGAGEAFSCLVDGKPCNPGTGGADGAPSGWLTLSKHFAYDDLTCNGGHGCGGQAPGDGNGGNGDMHDNSIYYTWCANVQPATAHTIVINHASFNFPTEFTSGGQVFFEGAHFFIDADSQRAGCAAAPTPGADPHAVTTPGTTAM